LANDGAQFALGIGDDEDGQIVIDRATLRAAVLGETGLP